MASRLGMGERPGLMPGLNGVATRDRSIPRRCRLAGLTYPAQVVLLNFWIWTKAAPARPGSGSGFDGPERELP
jgi:hypothetical protein